MVLTSRTHTTLFASATTAATASATIKTLVRLPLSVVPHYEHRCPVTGAIVPTANKPLFRTNLWSSDEHERFLHGLEMFPTGPWKEVAKVVGTKTTRQTMTHAQKYRQKIERRMHAKPKTVTEKTHRRNELERFYTDSHISENTTQFDGSGAPAAQAGDAFPQWQMGMVETATATPFDICGPRYDLNYSDQGFATTLKTAGLRLRHGDASTSYSFLDELSVCIV